MRKLVMRAPLLLTFVAVASAATVYHRAPVAATKVRLTLATLHAAGLTSPRAADDSVDSPYFLVAVVGPHASKSTFQLPDAGHYRIHQDEALGSRPLTSLSLEPGDTVRVLVSVIAGAKVLAADESAAAAASTAALSQPAAALNASLAAALAPITRGGARWLGSATLTVTNEGGTVYWHSLQCVATCKVVSGAAAKAFPPAGEAPAAGVVELSGNGATYHMAVQGAQAQ